MMRVDRLVVPAAKSCCSTTRVRLPARAHCRAIATPLMPPPITMTWKRSPSSHRRVGTGRCIFALDAAVQTHDSAPVDPHSFALGRVFEKITTVHGVIARIAVTLPGIRGARGSRPSTRRQNKAHGATTGGSRKNGRAATERKKDAHHAPSVAPFPSLIYSGFTHAHHRRTLRTRCPDHGPPARPRRLPMGPRADLRLHQALHARRDLRSARGHRQPRLARTHRGTRRPASPGALLFPNGTGTGHVLRRRRPRPLVRQTRRPPSSRVWRCEGRNLLRRLAQLGGSQSRRKTETP